MRSLRVALAREDGLAEARLARQHHQRGVGLRDTSEVEEIVGLAEAILDVAVADGGLRGASIALGPSSLASRARRATNSAAAMAKADVAASDSRAMRAHLTI